MLNGSIPKTPTQLLLGAIDEATGATRSKEIERINFIRTINFDEIIGEAITSNAILFVGLLDFTLFARLVDRIPQINIKKFIEEEKLLEWFAGQPEHFDALPVINKLIKFCPEYNVSDVLRLASNADRFNLVNKFIAKNSNGSYQFDFAITIDRNRVFKNALRYSNQDAVKKLLEFPAVVEYIASNLLETFNHAKNGQNMLGFLGRLLFKQGLDGQPVFPTVLAAFAQLNFELQLNLVQNIISDCSEEELQQFLTGFAQLPFETQFKIARYLITLPIDEEILAALQNYLLKDLIFIVTDYYTVLDFTEENLENAREEVPEEFPTGGAPSAIIAAAKQKTVNTFLHQFKQKSREISEEKRISFSSKEEQMVKQMEKLKCS